MKYVLLIYQPDQFDPKSLPPEEHAAIGKEYGAISGDPRVEPGLPLGHLKDAVTVRVHEGATDAASGPYVSDAGAVGGYMVLEAATREEAIEMAARIPAARLGGAVEVRPAQAYW